MTAVYRIMRAGLPAAALALGWLEIPCSAAAESPVPPATEPLRLASGPSRVALLELFTSEGCSSCPPADLWLGRLRQDAGLWRDYVPMEFHVNYWDALGWKDRFASRAFTQRQYAHAAAWGTPSVYTPCFVRDGAEWHPDGPAPTPSADRPGVLIVTSDPSGGYAVEFTPTEGLKAGPFTAHLALMGGGWTSRVTGGENRGSTLAHEFVVVELGATPLLPDAQGRIQGGRLGQKWAVPEGARRVALAAWVTRGNDLAPVQAAGGWLPAPGGG